MKLYLENIGNLANTKIELNGITVIAGNNGTGKSTVGKAIYSTFNGLHNKKEDIKAIRSAYIKTLIESKINSYIMSNIDDSAYDIFADILYKNKEIYSRDLDKLKLDILNFLTREGDKDNGFLEDELGIKTFNLDDDLLNNVLKVLNFKSLNILEKIVKESFNIEFNNQFKNLKRESEDCNITLKYKDEKVELKIDGKNNCTVKNPNLIDKKIIYIDDPYIIDDISKAKYYYFLRRTSIIRNHRDNLLIQLLDSNGFKNFLIDDEIKIIKEQLDKASDVKITEDDSDYYFNYIDSEEKINLKNASTGLKTFLIIRILLENGSLQKDGVLILDEPETHLHPDWQILFAELIVLLNKYLNIKVLLNTHSPYFLRAIEVYASKYEINENAKYYFSKVDEKSSLFEIEDVTTNLEKVYSSLASAFDRLEEEYID